MVNRVITSEIYEVTGTISIVYPVEIDQYAHMVQKIVIDNAVALNSNTTVGPRVLLIVKVSEFEDVIDFTVGSAITAKGSLNRGNANFLDTLHTIHAPTGYIRYKGKIYR